MWCGKDVLLTNRAELNMFVKLKNDLMLILNERAQFWWDYLERSETIIFGLGGDIIIPSTSNLNYFNTKFYNQWVRRIRYPNIVRVRLPKSSFECGVEVEIFILREVHTLAIPFLKSMPKRVGSDKERLRVWIKGSFIIDSRVVLCRSDSIRHCFQKWLSSGLPVRSQSGSSSNPWNSNDWV